MLKSPTGKFTKEAEKMSLVSFPVIDPAATGRNIMRLRLEQGLTVRDVQVFFGFEEPQAIYKWQSGKSLPTVDNLYALSALLDVQMDEILVAAKPELKIAEIEPQAEACGSIIFIVCFVGAVIELLVESAAKRTSALTCASESRFTFGSDFTAWRRGRRG